MSQITEKELVEELEKKFKVSGSTELSKQIRVRTHYSHQMTAAARAIAAMKF